MCKCAIEHAPPPHLSTGKKCPAFSLVLNKRPKLKTRFWKNVQMYKCTNVQMCILPLHVIWLLIPRSLQPSSGQLDNKILYKSMILMSLDNNIARAFRTLWILASKVKCRGLLKEQGGLILLLPGAEIQKHNLESLVSVAVSKVIGLVWESSYHESQSCC